MTTTVPARAWLPGFILLAAMWGNSFLFIKVAIGYMHPIQVTLIRVAVGAVVLLAVIAAARQRLPRDVKTWGHMFVAAAIMTTLPFTLFGYGEQHVSSVLAAIWNATTPLCTLVFTMALLKGERPTPARILGLTVGFFGVMVVLGVWRPMDVGAVAGSVMCFAAAVCYGIGGVYLRRFLSDRPEPGTVLACGQLIASTAQLLLVAFIVGLPPLPLDSAPVGWANAVALGVLGTGFAYALMYRSVRVVGLTTTSTVTYVIPVFAAASGILILGEHITWNQPLGAIVVLAGVALTQGLWRRKVAEPVPNAA